MKYFQCPKLFRGKPYGCGRGPYNGTQACLDLMGRCPCGKSLKPYRPPKLGATSNRCTVKGVITNAHYCDGKVVSGTYCQRHAYLNHTTPVTT